MVEKRYEWADGAKLEEHSRRKHKFFVSTSLIILPFAANYPNRNVSGLQ